MDQLIFDNNLASTTQNIRKTFGANSLMCISIYLNELEYEKKSTSFTNFYFVIALK